MFGFLRPSVPMSKSFMRIPRISGIICGIWPQRTHSCIKLLVFGFNAFAVAMGAVGENLYGFVHLNDLENALEAFCPGVTKAISLLKMLVFFVYNHRWYTITQRVRSMLMAEQLSRDKMEIVEKLASAASVFCFALLSSGNVTNLCFNLRPVVANVMRYYRGQEQKNVFQFNIIIPEIFANYPFYPATYLFLLLSGMMTVCAFSYVDGFFVSTCLYMTAVFRMIQHDIREIFSELRECETTSSAQNRRCRLQLAAVVERHNAIIDLCSDFTENFTLIVLMHFLSAALVLCLSILDLMLVSREASCRQTDASRALQKNSTSLGLLVYIFYSIAALTQLFLYCIGGSYISESSAAVADTLYDIEWYKCDVKTRKMILMMLRRSQKATTIAVPFFTPSLSTFSTILSTAGSYIALLKTFL